MFHLACQKPLPLIRAGGGRPDHREGVEVKQHGVDIAGDDPQGSNGRRGQRNPQHTADGSADDDADDHDHGVQVDLTPDDARDQEIEVELGESEVRPGHDQRKGEVGNGERARPFEQGQNQGGDDAGDDQGQNDLPAKEGRPHPVNLRQQKGEVFAVTGGDESMHPADDLGSIFGQIEADQQGEDGQQDSLGNAKDDGGGARGRRTHGLGQRGDDLVGQQFHADLKPHDLDGGTRTQGTHVVNKIDDLALQEHQLLKEYGGQTGDNGGSNT